MLKNLFAWKPDLQQFVDPLHVSSASQLEFGLFKKGIDNIHIDVLLSAEFRNRSQILVRKMLLHNVAENYWGEPPPPPDSKDVQAMKDSYAGIMEMAVANASQKSQPELIQLLQLSVVKFFLQLIDREFTRLREQLRGAKGKESHDSTGKSVEAHDRLVILAKNEPGIRYKITRKLFREILWVERTRTTKLRKSVLGASWQLPKQLLFNPMLQLPSLWADAELMNHYTLVCTAKDNQEVFTQVNQIVIGLFADYLPSWCQPLQDNPPPQPSDLRDLDSTTIFTEGLTHGSALGFNQIRRMLGNALQQDEYQQGLISWLDSPQNIDRIIYSIQPRRRWSFEGSDNIYTSSWVSEKWPRYYHRLLKQIFKACRASRLEADILACQAAPGVYKELREQLPVRLICQYLAGHLKRKDLQRRLTSSSATIPHQHILKILDQSVASLNTMPRPRRRKHLLGFLHQFAQFRRDLKLAYRTHLAMNRIRLLERNAEADLSRNNGTLHEFVLRNELQRKQHQIRNHVILKADVRGSTEMTSLLKQRGLNPATHFSLNFFEPINDLLPVFGAKKVFVEGDAVILSVYEYEDTPFQWLCVAHACGLAKNILQVVDAQNIKNRKFGLPNLELGLGIAFNDQSPAFLYDEEREIMISPAINRADQLSSCSAMLKRSSFAAKQPRGLEVFSLDPGEVHDKESGDRLVRYNVNGIELDIGAFYKLKSEVTLKKIDIRGAPYATRESNWYAGRYPDMQGRMHWLIIREAMVKEWREGAPVGIDQARRFYQVVTDEELIRDIRSRAGGSRSKPVLLDDEPEASEQAIKPFYFH